MRVAWCLLSLAFACGRPASSDESSGTESEASSEVGAGAEAGSESTDAGLPDAGDLPPHLQACDPFAGPECPEGEKCSPYDDDEDGEWDIWRCFPLPQSQGSHAPCSQPLDGPLRGDNCEAGLLCADALTADADDGWCAPVCDSDHPCPSGSSCLPAPEGFFSWCRPTCNPNDEPSSCPLPELTCSFGLEAEFVCNQRITVEGQQGEACALPTQCSYGLICLSGAVVGPEVCGAHAACCTALCDTVTPDCPTEAPTCSAVFPNGANPGFESLGYCGI